MRSFLGQLDQWKSDWTLVFPNDPDDDADGVRAEMRGAFGKSSLHPSRKSLIPSLL